MIVLCRSFWLVGLTLLLGMLVLPDVALAQSACTITAAQVPTLSVVRGSGETLVMDASSPTVLAQMRSAGGGSGGCDNAEIQRFNTETSGGASLNNSVNATLPSGSTFRVVAVGVAGSPRRLFFTPSATATSPESVSPTAAGTSGTHQSGGLTFTNQVIRFYHDSQSAGAFFSVRVTIVSPNAPTAALTSLNPTSITAGGNSTVTVTLTNPNSSATLSGVANTINLPTGVTVAATPGASTTCTSGAITAAAGASTVSLSGASMAGSATCTMTFNVTSSTVNTYTIPSGTPSATGANAGSAGTTALLTVTAPPAPTVTAVAPTSGPAAGGTSVTITGTNFTGVSGVAGVKFGTTNATAYTLNSATQITATAPAGTGAGTVDVTVTNAGGTSATSAADQYTYVAAPTVTAITPSSGPIGGGTSVTITGTGFTGVSGAAGVKFGTINATAYTINSATQITATAPAGTGTVDVTVTSTGGTSATSAADQFTYVAAPTVTSVAPTSGPATGGTTVTITGTGFSGATAVTFGATAATGFTVNSGTSITATSPAGTGTVDVRVTTTGGTSATSAADQFTYIAAPTVTAIAPTSGPAVGGTTVTITGTAFSGATAVTFGATAAASFTVNSATSITATSPAGTGTVDIRVTTTGGTSATSAADQFTYIAAPTVTAIAPTSGPATGGTTVILTGTGFSGATAVTFGATAATEFTVNSAMQITATAPAGTGTVNVRVTTTGGTSATGAANQYTYVGVPTVTSISPTSGPAAGGTTVTITGTGFTGATAVTFGATAATGFTVNSATQITATVPAGTGTVDVRVTSTGGTSATSAADQFTYVAAPTVTSITPTLGPATGGTTVTITGTGFTGATAVTFGATAAASFTVVSATQITATSPAGTGTVDIRVTTTGGTSATSAADQFTYVGAPTVTSIAPTAGPATGGTTLTITGTGFTGATAVTFGATAATGFTVNSGTSITATSPAGTGTVDVRVTTTGGTSATSAADQYTYVAAPVANSFTASAVAYNSGGAGAATFSVAGQVSGNPTSYAVTSAITANGGAVSISAVGLVSYTPLAGFRGNDSFQYNASNGGGPSANATVTVPVNNPIFAITLAGNGMRGAALSNVQLNTTGGLAPYSCNTTLVSGALPGGTALNANCTITGTPSASGSFNFIASVTDSSTGTGPFTDTSGTLTLVIAVPTLSMSPAAGPLPGATAGTAYAQTISASGGTAPYSYAITAGALPAGISLSAAGALTGTPTATGSFTFTVTSTDSSGAGSGGPYTVANAYTLIVAAPTIALAPASLPAGTIGTAYAQAITASGGTATYSYAVTAGALPGGLSLAANGTLAGTPSAGGTFTFTVTATDSTTGAGAPYTGSRAYTVTIGAPAIVLAPTTLTDAAVGASYTATITASGGTGGYNYAVTAGTLPTGVSLAANGTLSGTATAAGSFAFTVTATDSSGGAGPYTGARAYTLTVAAPTITLAPAVLPNAATGAAYSQTITASGGIAPYSYAVTAGALPAGLTLSATGTLAGTPSAGGSFAFTVTATDSTTGTGAPFSGARAYALTVTAPTIAIAPAALPGGTVGTNYSQTVTASGGTASYAFAVTAGALPAGLSLSATGVLSGTATTAGTYNFTITATDSSVGGGPYIGSRAYTLVIAAPTLTLAPTTLPAPQIAVAYSTNLTASGGTAPYSYTVTAGALPAGLMLAANGTLSGTATSGGTFNFTVTATDSSTGTGAPFSVARAYALTPGAATIAVAPGALANGTVAASYSQTITASGGTAPYSYALTAGALPAGVTLANTGTLSGTPTTAGTFNFSITATDSSGGAGPYSGVVAYSVTIAKGNQAITFAPLANASLSASPLTLSATSSSALAVTFTSATTGVCTVAGTSLTLVTAGTCTVNGDQAGDANFNAAAQVQRSFTVTPAGLSVTPGAPTGTSVGASYAQANPASGGTAPYTYALASGALPAGTTLNAATGTVSGTPTTAGAFTYAVRATDSQGAPATATGATVTATIAKSNQTITFAALANASLSASPLTLAATSSSGLANGFASTTAGVCTVAGTTLTLVSTGTCTITADQVGDTNYNAATQVQRSFTVTPAGLNVTAGAPTGTTVGASYAQANPASGGTAPYTYALTSGALPTGTTLNTATGAVSGTPTMVAVFNYAIQATDSQGTPVTATGASVTATIAKGNQAITFAALANASLSASPLTLSATTSAPGLLVTFTSTTAGVCTVAGTTLTLATAGTCTVNADQAGDTNYNAATQVQRSFTVTPAGLSVTPGAPTGTTVGASYAQANPASGGTAPYTYALASGALPTGTTLNAATGAVSGTPTTAGAFTYAVRATDSQGAPATATGATVMATIAKGSQTITFAALANAPLSASSLTLAATTSAPGLGVTFASATTGVCTVAGTSLTLVSAGTCTVNADQAGDANFNVAAQVQRSFTVTPAGLSVTPGAPTGTSVGASYAQANPASGGTAPYTYALASGALPTGTTLNAATGAVSGTPTTAGAFTYAVRATDSQGVPATATGATVTATIAPAPLTIAPASLSGATVAAGYAQAITASGGTAPYSYAVTAGALPAGLTLAASGNVSGTPTAGGTFNLTVTVTDANGATVSRAYALAVAAPTLALVPVTLPDAPRNIAYSQSVTASGGVAPYSYAVTAGALPAGLSLSTAGVLSGTPTTTGAFAFTIAATDSGTGTGPYTTSRAYDVTVTAPAITLAPGALAAASVGSAYSTSVSATGGVAPYSYSVTAGALPAGLTLANTGTLSGTPTAGGAFSVTITAADANANGGSRAYTLTVGAPTIALAPETLPAATRNVAYSQTLSASGGVAPYRYTVSAGALPAGLTVSATGVLSGTPTAGGSFAFTVTATDQATGSGPYAGSQAYTLTVATPAIAVSPATLPGGVIGAAYSAAVTASGGSAPYAFTVTPGALPGGLTLGTGGAVSGTPNAAGTFAFTISATDANGNSGGQAYTVAIAQAEQTISFANPGTRSLSASPIALAATASSGLAVSYRSTTTAICTVSGSTVTLLQTGGCAITASQAGNASVAPAADVTQSFAVTAATLVANPAQASISGTVGVALTSATPVTASGGTAPYSYALTGTLPAGISFSTATGTVSGIPTGGQAASAYSVTITDAGNQTASADFTLAIAAPTLTLNPATLPDGALAVAYSQQLSAAGGIAPYSFAVTAGALPAGVTLSAGGLVSGTPTAFGTFNVTIAATDRATGTGPYSVAQSYALVIRPPATPIAGNVSVTVAYGAGDTAIQPVLSGGVVIGLAIGTAPSHGTARIDGDRLIYAPAAGYAGPDSFTYTASNAGGTSAPATVSVTVTGATIMLTPAALPAARQGFAYSQQLSASGGAAPYSYAVTSGTLPAGLTLSSTGLLSGTPSASGTANFAITATDRSTGTGPFAAVRSYQLAIDLPAPPETLPVPRTDAGGSTVVRSVTTEIPLSDFVTGNFTDLQIVTQPQRGTVVLSRRANRIVASYTPQVGYAGPDSFVFVAVGPGGQSAPQSVAITVAGTAPVATAITTNTMQGVPVTIDLTTTASGGPFTAAQIVATTPAGSVTTAIVEAGVAGNRTYRLTITPAVSFSGSATVSYALSNQFGTSAPAIVTITVAARPDPTADAVVNGITSAQNDATRRFATAQIDNFSRRNEELHNGGNGSGGMSMGVNLTGGDPWMGPPVQAPRDDFAMLKLEHAQAVAGAEYAAGLTMPGRDGGFTAIAGSRRRGFATGGRGDGTVQGRGQANALGGRPGPRDAGTSADENVTGGDGDSGGRAIGSLAIWSGGAITVGTRDQTTLRGKLSLTTGGLSSGTDIKLSDALIVGIGGGYGADTTKIDGGKARVFGNSWSLAGYGSWTPVEALFIDGVFGGGTIDFDTQRTIAQTGALARGIRSGDMWFGSLAAGFDRISDTETFNLSLYGRVDWMAAKLGAYRETGGGLYDLTFARRNLNSFAGVLGGRLSYPGPGWIARVRGEWRHEFSATSDQLLDYADLNVLRYRANGDEWLRDAYSIDFGGDFGLGSGWTLGGNLGFGGGTGALFGTTRIELRKQF